jgi:hypothetical protein
MLWLERLSITFVCGYPEVIHIVVAAIVDCCKILFIYVGYSLDNQ